MTWMQRLRRVFAIDSRDYPRCARKLIGRLEQLLDGGREGG